MTRKKSRHQGGEEKGSTKRSAEGGRGGFLSLRKGRSIREGGREVGWERG